MIEVPADGSSPWVVRDNPRGVVSRRAASGLLCHMLHTQVELRQQPKQLYGLIRAAGPAFAFMQLTNTPQLPAHEAW